MKSMAFLAVILALISSPAWAVEENGFTAVVSGDAVKRDCANNTTDCYEDPYREQNVTVTLYAEPENIPLAAKVVRTDMKGHYTLNVTLENPDPMPSAVRTTVVPQKGSGIAEGTAPVDWFEQDDKEKASISVVDSLLIVQ